MTTRQTMSDTDWATEVPNLNADSLDDLLSNRIAAIRVTDFASSDECRAFCEAAEEHGYDYYKDVIPPIGKIGITQFEAGASGGAAYFAKAGHAIRSLETISASSFDPVGRVAATLSKFASAGVAVEPGSGCYFAGLVRQIRTALLHIDWGPLDGPVWEIGRINAQLAWNIYLKVPGSGGECIVYDRPWDPDSENLKVPGSYAYSESLVEKANRVRLVPRVGDLVIFNSRNFHEVKLTEGERITVSSFIGRKANGELCLWS
jgi:2OG-Fe(II) oxygenase superfamily